jgi:uncharacterized protein YeaO (DUF488 family)
VVLNPTESLGICGISTGRSFSKSLQIGYSLKELSPSTELRQWFGHDPKRFQEFRQRYMQELSCQRPRLTALRRRAREGTLTLVYSAHDTEHNDAVVLAEVLRRGLPKGQGGR